MERPFLRLRKLLVTLRAAWAIIGLTLLMLIILELVCRTIGGSSPGGMLPTLSPSLSRSDWFDGYLEEAGDFRLEWHPYIYWRLSPMAGKYINVNHEGFRHTWTPPRSEETMKRDPVRIFMFGGSTLWGSYARDAFTIPSHLAKILYNEHGIRTEITNFGESGYVNTQEMIAFLLEIRKGNLPDIAIFYDGVNDVFSAYQNGIAGLPQQEWHRREEFNLLGKKGGMIPLLVKSLQQTAISRLLLDRSSRDNDEIHVREIEPDDARHAVDSYVANVEIIRALADAYPFTCLFYWQPVVFSRKAPSTYDRHLENMAGDAGLYYRKAYALIEASVTLSGIEEFHDISTIFDECEDPVYVDFCHVTEQGGERVARRMSGDVVKIIQGLEREK